MADEQAPPHFETMEDAIAAGYADPPAPQAQLKQGGGIDMVDLSQYGYIPGAIGSGYNYGASALNSINDWMKEREAQETNPVLSGLMAMPRTTVEDVTGMVDFAGKGIGNYMGARGTGQGDLSAKLDTLNTLFPEGKRLEALGSVLGTGAGMIPQLKALNGPFAGIEKSVLPYLGSVLGAEAVNQGEQLVGTAPDSSFSGDMSDMVREGIAHGGQILPMTPIRNTVAGVARSIEEMGANRAVATSVFLNKDLNRVQAFFDDPAQAVTRQGTPMQDALKAPDIKPLLENLPRSISPKFNLWTEIQKRLRGPNGKSGAIGEAGAEIGNIIESLPPEANISVRSLWESKGWQKLEDMTLGGGGGAIADIVDPVLKKEKMALATQALSEEDANRYKSILNKQGRVDRGQNATLGDYTESRLLTETEKADLTRFENLIKDMKLSPSQIREMKTNYDNFARYDAMSDADALSRADVYKDIGSVFRDKLHDAIKDHSPRNYDKFVAANTKYGTLLDLESANLRREAAVNLKGSRAKVGGFQAQEGKGTAEGKAKDVYPEIDTPETRLYRASDVVGEAPGRMLVGVKNIGSQAEALAARGVNKYNLMSNQVFNNPVVSGYMGMRAGQDATQVRASLSTGELFSSPEMDIPEQLKQDKEFMQLYQDGKEMTEENRLTALSDYLLKKGSEVRDSFQRSPYVGYTTVKDSDGFWRIMDENQKVAFADKIIREEKDPIMQAKKLKSLNESGRIIEGGRVNTSSGIQWTKQWEGSPKVEEPDFKVNIIPGIDNSDGIGIQELTSSLSSAGIEMTSKGLDKLTTKDAATIESIRSQLSARKEEIATKNPVYKTMGTGPTRGLALSGKLEKELKKIEELEAKLDGFSTAKTINGKRQEPDY